MGVGKGVIQRGKLVKRSQGKPRQPLNAESARALPQGFNRKTISETPATQSKNIGIPEPAEHKQSSTHPGVTIPLGQLFAPAFAHAVSDAVLSGCSNFAGVRFALNQRREQVF